MLSDRVRPNCEAAPWVVEEIKKLEKRLSRAIEVEVRAEAQELVGGTNDAAKMRFFRDQVSTERRKVFEVFGIESAVLNEVRSLSDETRLFRHLFTAPQPPAPCPDCEQYRAIIDEEAKDSAQVIIERDALQTKAADLELEVSRLQFADDGISALEAKVFEQSAEIERLTAEAEVHSYWRLFETSQATIAQQAERIAELEQQQETSTAMLQSACLKDVSRDRKIAEQAALIAELELQHTAQTGEWHKAYDIAAVRQAKVAEQAALIEKCENALEIGRSWVVIPEGNCSCHLSPPCNSCIEKSSAEHDDEQMAEALAAIAAQKGGA